MLWCTRLSMVDHTPVNLINTMVLVYWYTKSFSSIVKFHILSSPSLTYFRWLLVPRPPSLNATISYSSSLPSNTKLHLSLTLQCGGEAPMLLKHGGDEDKFGDVTRCGRGLNKEAVTQLVQVRGDCRRSYGGDGKSSCLVVVPSLMVPKNLVLLR